MSRIIKFRAWDGNKIIPEDTVIYFVEFDGTIWENKGNYLHDKLDSVGNEYELMQFTGLYDKNSKEIYEGDILKHRLGNLVVYWHERLLKFVVDMPIIGGDTAPCDLFQFYDLECIGNIYENTELIK